MTVSLTKVQRRVLREMSESMEPLRMVEDSRFHTSELRTMESLRRKGFVTRERMPGREMFSSGCYVYFLKPEFIR